MVNATGKYCGKCKADIHQRSLDGMANSHARNKPAACVWCGIAITETNARVHHTQGGKVERVCRSCDTRRAWLLACIRYGAHAARYVSACERRECQGRNERRAAALAAAATIATADPELPLSLPVAPTSADSDARLARLEKMMTRLLTALGE